MAEFTCREALNQALREEMARNPNVFILGEDVGLYEGSFKVTRGLLAKFGERRVVGEINAACGSCRTASPSSIRLKNFRWLVQVDRQPRVTTLR